MQYKLLQQDKYPSIVGVPVFGYSVFGAGYNFYTPKAVVDNLQRPIYQRDTLALYSLNSTPICFVRYTNMDTIEYKIDSWYGGAGGMGLPVNSDISFGEPEKILYHIESNNYVRIKMEYVKMVQWDRFHEYVMPSVQGCPVAMVNTAIRSACAEFCEKSHIWKQESIDNDVIENVYLYSFAPPIGSKVVTPYRVAIYDRELYPTDLETLEHTNPKWRDTEEELPKEYFLVTDNTIRLIGKPSKSMEASLTAGVVLKPSRDATSCPSFLYDDWVEVIAAGALSKLLAMRGKIWAQEALVPFYDRIFRAGIARAKSKSSKSWQKESKDMLPRKFY